MSTARNCGSGSGAIRRGSQRGGQAIDRAAGIAQHLPPVARAAGRASAHGGRGDRAKLIELIRRYEATDSGLDAALRLAGLELEGGEAATASAVLKPMPPITRRSSRPKPLWHELSAAAALLLDHRAAFTEHRKALDEAGVKASVESLDRLAKNISPKAVPRSYAARIVAPPRNPRAAKEPLWSLPVGGAERFMARNYSVESGQIDDQLSGANT